MPPPENGKRTWSEFARLLASGIVVAFTVPLFLSLAQSTLVQQILEPKDMTNQYPQLLIFLGFCIAASFASRAFLDTLSQRVLAAVRDAKAVAIKAEEKAERAEATVGLVEESIDRASGTAIPQPQHVSTPALQAEAAAFELSPLQTRALQAVGRLTMRTATGIAKDAGIPRDQVGEMLDELIRMRLVEKTTSPNTGGLRHRLTPLGIAVLNRQLTQ